MREAAVLLPADLDTPSTRKRGIWRFVRRNPTLVGGIIILMAVTAVALLAPLIAGDPVAMKPANRLKAPSEIHWLGTDHLGRDVWARTVYGARISLLVGLSVAAISMAVGLCIGMLAGFIKVVESVVMRLMDGLMAIPAILLAIALVSLTKASVLVVIAAILIPEIPRVVRLVRSVVLTVREAAGRGRCDAVESAAMQLEHRLRAVRACHDDAMKLGAARKIDQRFGDAFARGRGICHELPPIN